MKQVEGIWLPDHEQHLVEWKERADGKLAYQTYKLAEALKYTRNFRAAIDIGAHCGLWSLNLVKLFDRVHAFEPVEEHRECYKKNVIAENFILNPVALCEKNGFCSIFTSWGSSGDSWVNGDGEIPVHTLDMYDVRDVDFIKLDCEGYEYFALKGGEDTLKKWKPCVIVEQKPNRAQKFGLKETQAVTYLESLGAKLRYVMTGDYILSWDE